MNILRTLLFVICHFFFITSTASAQDYTVIRLTENILSDYNPVINDNNQVAWSGGTRLLSDRKDSELFFYDGLITSQITDNALFDGLVSINSHGHILLFQSQADGTNEELLLLDGTDITLVTDSKIPYEWNLHLNDNDFVVWGGFFEGSFLYDGSTIKKFEAYVEEYPDSTIVLENPDLNNRNQVVLQGRLMNGSSLVAFAIFLYSGSVLEKVIDLSPFPLNSIYPHINDNGHIAWQRFDGTDYEIVLYDGATIKQLTSNDYDDLEPQINNNGSVVWSSSKGIFLYDGRIILKIPESDHGNAADFQINDNNYVVWWARDPCEDAEIFLYDGSKTIKITNNDYDDIRPQINNNNYIVWYEQFPGGIAHTEVFLAIPENTQRKSSK